MARGRGSTARRGLRRFARLFVDRRGGVSVMLTLMLIPMVAMLGVAVEASSWFLTQRSMQNAADSAAVAAAANGCAATIPSCVSRLSPYYDVEARSVASKFGYENGVSNTTVAASNTATCPSGDTNCYSVTITRRVPIYMVRLAGFNGDTTVGGDRAQTVTATAVASPRGAATGFCIIGLGGGDSVRINGGPNVDLAGCDIRSNGNAVCNGANSDTGVNYGYAVGASSCGVNEVGGSLVLADPYAYLNANPPIPPDTCGGVYSTPQSLTATEAWSSPVPKCGNTRLSADVDISTPNSVLVIYNGHLDLRGHRLRTTGTGSLTIIFSGTRQQGGGATAYDHVLMNSTGNGSVDIAAPTSGPLSGVAIYQDKRLDGNKNNVDYTYNGNDPTLNIQGLIYMPNATFDVRGAINLHSGGLSCIGVVAKNVLVSGQGSVFDNATSQCAQAGLILPTIPGSNQRQALVR